ncbi:hypothetical protein [uncultured Nocardioides sp.]|uniref:hypothetical protein n=1 Tax=uncultured Nocardioides sp. TaxID=198441 RepID=UPI0026166B1B|nr:hypothetical protein [uncultured Nocardioides sp.]
MSRLLGRRRLLPAAVVASLLVGGWWWAHPDVLDEEYGASMRAAPVEWREGRVFSVGLTDPGQFPAEGTLRLRTVTVRLSKTPEEDPTVEVLRCREVLTEGGGSLALGALHRRPPREHDCAAAAGPGTVLGPEHQLVAVLQPGSPGRYRISGLTVGYRLDRAHLWRTGTETMSTSVSVGFRK